MEIGVSTASLFGRYYNEEALPILDKADSRVVEIFLETFSEYTVEYAKLLVSRLGGLKVHSIHTINTHFEPQLFSLNPRAFDDAVKIFRGTLECARVLGAKNYTLHGIPRIKRDAKFTDYPLYGKRLAYLCDLTDEYGVELCLENVEWALYGSVGFLSEVAPSAPKLKCCFDVKQAIRSGFDYRDYIKEMKGRINTVHLSDVGSCGRVVLPGKGDIDFRELFCRLADAGFDGNMLIEVYKDSFGEIEEIAESLRYLRKIKKEVFGE